MKLNYHCVLRCTRHNKLVPFSCLKSISKSIAVVLFLLTGFLPVCLLNTNRGNLQMWWQFVIASVISSWDNSAISAFIMRDFF